jgi:hypothetical protein
MAGLPILLALMGDVFDETWVALMLSVIMMNVVMMKVMMLYPFGSKF